MELYNKYFEGYFWIPGKEENKIISTLFIDEKGLITITSLESLVDDKVFNRNWDKINLVLGYINCHDDSKTYTIKLYDVYPVHKLNGNLNKFKYSSNKSLITPKFDSNINSTLYETIMLGSDLINNWVPITGFDFKKEASKKFEVNQGYSQPEIIELFKNDELEIYIFFRAITGFKERRSSFIKENVFINIQTSKPYEVKELFKLKLIIERLISLILFIPYISKTVELSTIKKVNYQIVKKIEEFKLFQGDKINFEVFRKSSQNVFFKWFEKQNILELAIINFFSVYGQKGVLVENKFLTYISILENFHKNNIHKKGYLKTRLKYLLEKSIIGDKLNNIENFSETLKTTRNYHVHLAEERKVDSLTTQEIVTTNLLLEFVIREIFLREIELNENIQIPSKVQDYLNVLNTK